MKMTNTDYHELKQAILQLPKFMHLQNPNASDMMHRWDLYHQANHAQDFYFWHLHEYLNDNHIDTALRMIILEMRERE